MNNTLLSIARKAVSLLAAAALSMAVFPAGASAYSTDKTLVEGCYTIIPKCARSSCIDISGAGTKNGTDVQIWTDADVDQQRFYVTCAGGGNYHITAVHSGKRLDVDSQSKSSGANVHQWEAHSGQSQQWKIRHTGSGWYTVQNVRSGKYLDVSGAGSADGTTLIQYTGNSTDAQKFRFDAVVPESGLYELSPKCAPGSVLDAAGTGNGAPLQIRKKAGVNSQKFVLVRLGSSKNFEITAVHSKKRLDISSSASGAAVCQQAAEGGKDQQWALRYQGGGWYAVQNVSTGKYLDISGMGSADGTPAIQYDWNGSPAQLFKITPTAEAPAAFEAYQARVTAKTGLNMRKSASASAAKVSAIPKNTVITVTAEQNGWGKTSHNGKTGWVSLEYLAKVAAPAASGYQYPFPAGTYRTSCVYGKKGSSWGCGYHSGLDLVSDGDGLIYPVHGGTVARAVRNDRSYGNYLIIDHGDGYLSLYAHLEYFAKDFRPGDPVTLSTVLGKMGRTGNVTGAHLHLEIHRGSYSYPAAIDPAAFLNERI